MVGDYFGVLGAGHAIAYLAESRRRQLEAALPREQRSQSVVRADVIGIQRERGSGSAAEDPEGALGESEGLHKVLDLGEWWLLETGLPLPLGVNVARRDLGDRLGDLSAVLLDSIQAGLDNRREAMRYAMRFGRGIDTDTADRFVGMYVNELTCDYGDEGRTAVEELLRRGDAIGAFPDPVRLDYVS